MAFDLSRYNLTAFNASSNIRYMRMVFEEEVTTVMGVDTDIYLRAYCNERVDEEIDGAPCRYLDGIDGSEIVSEEVSEVIAIHYLTVSGTEDVTKELYASSDSYLTLEGSESVTAETALGQKLCLTNPMEENVTENISLGQNIWLEDAGYELVSESASLDAIHEKVCYIGTSANRLTLRPGQKLIIDASNYNVLLDGQNAIWYQSGDWLDELNRNTINIEVSASSGVSNLTATILYTELYL